MPYQFLDANSSILTADSSVVSGVIQRPLINVASILSPITIIGSPSISGAVTVVGNASVSGTVGSSVIGTVPVTQSGLRISSISGTVVVQSVVGTYAEDAPHTTGDAGLFNLAVRNDTLSSITSADSDYSPQAVGPSGELVAVNAPFTKWVQGVASCFTGVIQPVIAAQGSSVFTYITSGQVANASANNVYLTFYGAASSVVGYLPVPANSGALPIMPNAWKSNANGAFSASVSGVSSVFLSFQGFISKS